MHPDLDDYLEETFGAMPPVAGIGHLVIEPDYETAPTEEDRGALVRELTECVRGHQAPEEFAIEARYPVLRKYVRRVSLHADVVEGSWVEIVPPGNWI